MKLSDHTKCRYKSIAEDDLIVNIDTDQETLNPLGYKQELQRKLSLFATFGLAFSNIGILSGTSMTFQTVLQRGGPVTMLFSWNIVAFFMICVALSLAEICSLYPTTGGLYYWVYELLHKHPKGKSKASLIAFITGWIYYLANIICIGATNVTIALSLGSLIKLTMDIDIPKTYLMCITLGITLFHGFMNARDLGVLSILNQLNVFWSLTGLVCIIVWFSWTIPHQPASWVLLHYENQTGFDSPFYVVILGMIGAAYSLCGCECAASVNEETEEADIACPLAMVSAIGVSWIVGLLFLLVLLFSIQDMDAILNAELDLPVAQLFWDTVGMGGTVGFLILIAFCQFCTGITTITVASRQIYALARDDAAPISEQLRKLNQHKQPENAVWFTILLTCLVILPFPLSENLFETIVSAATITIHCSYAIVLGCKLLVPDPEKRKGRFNLGRWSRIVNLIGFGWTTFAVVAFVLPTSWPMLGSNANYAGIALCIVLLLTFLFWQVWGKYHYEGPKAMNDVIE